MRRDDVIVRNRQIAELRIGDDQAVVAAVVVSIEERSRDAVGPHHIPDLGRGE